MSDDVTLTPQTYAVLKRVPVEWWPEDIARRVLALALVEPVNAVDRRLQHLRRLGLVERRRVATVPAERARLGIVVTFEIRRIAKDD